MFNNIKTSFKLTNEYIILATPLIFFSLLSSLYLLFSSGGTVLSLLIAFILFTLMFAAFLSGWSNMLKNCVSEVQSGDANVLIKDFIPGVGEYFISVLGMVINFYAISALILFIVYILGMKFIGHIGISSAEMSGAFASTQTLKNFIVSLSDEQLLKLNLWNLAIVLGMGIEYFVLMFYFPVVSFKSKNPFKALFILIKDLFGRKFFSNLGLYLFLVISYIILSILTTFAGLNIITHFIFTLLNFYYLVFAALLIYHYYYVNYIKIGGKLDETV